MDVRLDASLLSDHAAPVAPWRRQVLLAMLLGAVGFVAVVLLAPGPSAQQWAVVGHRAIYEAADVDGRLGMSNISATAVPLNLDLPTGWNTECFTWTGGTCFMFGCDAERGDTECSSSRCMCTRGCAGSDGKCYNGLKNQIVASSFTLQNVKWPDQSMYIPSGVAAVVEDQLRTSTSDGSKFSLYMLPDGSYLMASAEWPDYVVDISLTEIVLPRTKNSDAVEIPRWDVRAHRLGWWHGGLRTSSLKICNPDDTEHPDAVLFRNMYSGTIRPATIFIRHGSWKIYGYIISDDPGNGGYWIPEPPLPFKLPSCNFTS